MLPALSFRVPPGRCKTCGAVAPKTCSGCQREVCDECWLIHNCRRNRTVEGFLPVIGLDGVERAFWLAERADPTVPLEERLTWFFESAMPDCNPLVDGYHEAITPVVLKLALMVPEDLRRRIILEPEGVAPYSLEEWLQEETARSAPSEMLETAS